MLVVIGLQFVVRHLHAVLNFRKIYHDVLDFALLRNRVRVIFLVTVVKGFQLFRRRMQSFLDVVLTQDGVFKLHLGILFIELLPDSGIAHRGAAGDQRLQFADQNFLAHRIFEGGGNQIVLLQQPLVFGLANERSSRKENFCIAPVLEFIFNFLRRGFQTHVLCLGH